MGTGFRSWNKFQREVRLTKQLYDYTSHLYAEEHTRLKVEAPSLPPQFETSTRAVTHNLDRTLEYTAHHYPERLRQLLLIASVSFLETFLSELIEEIGERTVTPFLTDTRVEVQRSQLLSYPSLEALRDDLIARDIRQLTNGGLKEFAKYYKTRLQIDFSSFQPAYARLLEAHERRHLHVHSGGICDQQYAHRYSAMGFSPGQAVPVDQAYFLGVLTVFIDFGGALRNAALALYPNHLLRKKQSFGKVRVPTLKYAPLIIRGELRDRKYDAVSQLPTLPLVYRGAVIKRTLNDFMFSIVVEDSHFHLVVSGAPREIRRIMHALRSCASIHVRSASPVW